jgi:peptide/nickel transport system substrate-binding protein
MKNKGMKKKLLFGLLVLTLVALPLFAACAKPTPTTTAPPTTPPPTTAPPTKANWWDKWGEPQYGGTMSIWSNFLDVITEPQDPRSSQFATWFETLFANDPTVDRAVFPFSGTFTPLEYRCGWLAEGWEMADPTTVTVKIRKGIHWQDKHPMEGGREFTADDVVYSFDRVLLTGSGFTEENAKQFAFFFKMQIPLVERVVKVDDYTVQFKLKSSSAMAIYNVVEPFLTPGFVSPEWDKLTDDQKTDWHNVVGTGPFILTDFVAGTSLTTTRNPNYWGYDERHPKNKLPYLDEIKVVVIPDEATAVAAMRTGKLDMMADDRNGPSLTTALHLKTTDPDIQQFTWPATAYGVFFKQGVKPFDDIRVRKAMQLAIDIPTIAATYYKGTSGNKPVGLMSTIYSPDWATPYDQWPADLQAEYSYDPVTAKQLLSDAGYPNGFNAEMMGVTTDDSQLQLVIADAFKQIGVNVTIVPVDMMTGRTLVMEGKYKQMLWAAAGGQTSPPSSALGAFWSTFSEKTGGMNGGIVDAGYDAIVDKFLKAATEDEAKAAFREADMYQLRQHWTVQVCVRNNPQICQSWLKGWAGENFWGQGGWFVRARCWIDQSLKK